jgi:hypothetical protein
VNAKVLGQTLGADNNAPVYLKFTESYPHGNLNNIETRSGGIWVRGWAADFEVPTTAIQVRVQIGSGQDAESFTLNANLQRTDIPRSYPQLGTDHGFNQTLTTKLRGEQPVYVYAVNAPGTPGKDALIATRTVLIGLDPHGNLNNIEARPGGQLWLRGWAADEDYPQAASSVLVSIGGEKNVGEHYMVSAGLWRSDIPRTYPQLGTDHGFNQTLTTKLRGEQKVYVYAVNLYPSGGADKLIAVRTVVLS